MDKAEALAFVSRMFDTAAAGAILWGDALLMKRFLSQCSRSGSAETVRGYKRELREFTRCGIAITPICIYERSTRRSARTGCPNCGNKSRQDT